MPQGSGRECAGGFLEGGFQLTGFFCGIFRGQLFRHARLMNLSGNLRESSVFREMEFSPEALASLDALMEDG